MPPPPKKDPDAKGDAAPQKKKFKGWKAQVGGGFDHQFFDNAKLDKLEKKEIEWSKYEDLEAEEKEKATPPAEFTAED